jgi:hypothetical protein
MGRRSRKRTPEGPVEAPPAGPARDVHARPRSLRARPEEAPPAPWSPFPLVELVVLLALILIVWAFVAGGDKRGTLLACGVLLGCLAGLELSVREHFTGFRSHSAILAGACALLVCVPLAVFTPVPQEVILVTGVLTFGGALWAFRAAFRRRSGGLSFRA